MGFSVTTYNKESGWSLGSFFSKAITEAEAIAEAVTRYSIPEHEAFKFAHSVVSAVEASEPVAQPVPVVTPEPEAVNAEISEPVAVVAATDVTDDLVADLKKLSPGELKSVFDRINSALGG